YISFGIPFSIALDRSLHGCPRLVYAAVFIGETTGRLDLSVALLLRMYRLQQVWRSSFDSWAVTSPRLFTAFWGLLFLLVWHGSQAQSYVWYEPPETTVIQKFLESIAGWFCEPLFYPLVGLLIAWYRVWRNRGGVGFIGLFRKVFRRLPWIGSMLQNRLTARCLRLLAFILETGKPPLEAVAVIAAFADRSDVQHVFRSSREILRNGGSLSQAFAVSEMLPERAIGTIAVAEDLGTLPETVAWLAETYEAQVGFESSTAGTLFTVGIVVVQIGLLIAAINTGFSPFVLLSGI
ncbi:type II secretion system F family protein, partial [Candidatus Ozemobacteraceae bacterium]|nr:type II secretion system F family protein [Candidatus Ozemobacteraceae bacterium]